MGRLLLVVTVFAAACTSKYEPTPETEDQMDLAAVTTIEWMADFASTNPTCAKWSEVNAKRVGVRRLKTLIDRHTKLDDTRFNAFRAKYGERVDRAAEIVGPFSEACIDHDAVYTDRSN